jgi:hypothetical protein
MLDKKLLTVACVVGIVVCGACGMFEREAPPPMTLFVGVHTVRVVVTNTSKTHQIEADAVRQAVVKEFNKPSHQSHMLAVAEGDADCTLSLDIVEEDARKGVEDPKGDGASWEFKALIDTKLAGRDGKQLWAVTKWPIDSTYGFYHLHGRTITNAWSERGFRNEFDAMVALETVRNVLSK